MVLVERRSQVRILGCFVAQLCGDDPVDPLHFALVIRPMQHTIAWIRTTLCLMCLVAGVALPVATQAAPPPSVTEVAEESFDALVKKGAKHFAKKEYDQALKLFEKAYTLEPDAKLLYNIARVYEAQGKLSKAVELYKKFAKAPGIDLEYRKLASERIKELNEIIALTGDTSGPSTTGHGGGGDVINLNTADVSQLKRLPGIGPKKAQAIVDFREANGPFTSVDALTQVHGIGAKTVDKLRVMVTIGETTP